MELLKKKNLYFILLDLVCLSVLVLTWLTLSMICSDITH